MSTEDLMAWLHLLIGTLDGRQESVELLPQAILFLMLTGAQLVEVDDGLTVIMGRMNLGGWTSEWRER